MLRAIAFTRPVQSLVRSASTQVALTEEIAGLATHGVPGVPAAAAAPAVSTTGAGLKVVTHEGQSGTTLTLVVGAGSRDETDANAGAAHLLKHLAFKNTTTRSEIRLGRDLEDAGCKFTAAATREALVYQVTTLPDAASVETAVQALAETAFSPRFKSWDVNTPKTVAGWELAAFEADQAAVAVEEAHAAAFHDQGLGRRFYNAASLAQLTSEDVAAFHAGAAGVDQAVLSVGGAAASGVDVNALATKAFGDAQKVGNAATGAAAAYKGGEARVQTVSGTASVAIALNGVAASSAAEAAAAAVLAQIVSGGAHNLCAAHHAYSDAGLFVVLGSSDGANAAGLVDSMAAALKQAAAGSVDAAALQAAKTKVKISVAGADRNGRAAALAVNTFATGQATAAGAAAAVADSVTAADVANIAKKALGANPTIASVGAIGGVPRYDALSKLLA